MQSAMSGALARLREYFGDELLVQVGRKMMPTPLGESLAGPVREILLQIKATINTRPVRGRPDIQLDRQRRIKVKVIRTLFIQLSKRRHIRVVFRKLPASKSLVSHRFAIRHPSV